MVNRIEDLKQEKCEIEGESSELARLNGESLDVGQEADRCCLMPSTHRRANEEIGGVNTEIKAARESLDSASSRRSASQAQLALARRQFPAIGSLLAKHQDRCSADGCRMRQGGERGE